MVVHLGLQLCYLILHYTQLHLTGNWYRSLMDCKLLENMGKYHHWDKSTNMVKCHTQIGYHMVKYLHPHKHMYTYHLLDI